MIHVATVHHQSDKWIDVQLAYLRRHLHEPYRVVANLEGVPGNQSEKFDRVIEAQGKHPGKLNLLAAEIASEAKPDDLIMFLDGDAFPIVDPMPTVHKALDETALIAVRRDENFGDKQPHPCFCVIRVDEWDRLRGDWSMGHSWPNDVGELVTDAGGNLMAALERTQSSWTPMLRSNRVNLHPLWFAIYGDVLYHHGAGFRNPWARGLAADHPGRWKKGEQLPMVGVLVRKAGSVRIRAWEGRDMDTARAKGEEIFNQLVGDQEFYRQFL